MGFGLSAIFEDEGFDRASYGEVKAENKKNIFIAEKEVSFVVVCDSNIETLCVALEISYTKTWSNTMEEIRHFNHAEMVEKFCNHFSVEKNQVFNTVEEATNHIEKNMYDWDKFNEDIKKMGAEIYYEFELYYGKVRGNIIGFKGEDVTSSNFETIVEMLPVPKDGYTWALEELRFTTIVLSIYNY